MIPNRIPLTREEVFDELMSGLNSSDPLGIDASARGKTQQGRGAGGQ